MKVRLTEAELVSLIKKVLNEQALTVDEAATIANVITKKMSGDVNSQILADIRTELEKVDGKFMEDGTCAMQKVLDYYKHYASKWWADTGSKMELIGDINEAGESSEPQFADNQKKTIAQINAAITKCATIKAQEVADQARSVAGLDLKSCASKEPGYSDKGGWWIIKPFGQGELRGFDDGHKNGNGNLFFVKNGSTSHSHVANGSCVNGVLDIGAWSGI